LAAGSRKIGHASNGSRTSTPAVQKSVALRVTTVRRCVRAVAAIRLSLTGIAVPAARIAARIPAQQRPVSRVQSRQVMRPTPRSNQSSSRLRRLPDGNRSIPNRSSPRMMGSTAIARSFRRSQSMTVSSGCGFVGSLRIFASTRYFTVTHRSSVDSEVTPTKKPFSGQESSQSAIPSFGGGSHRRSRYSPRSIRSISNCCPGWMSSCCRTAAGSTICPLLETRVFI